MKAKELALGFIGVLLLVFFAGCNAYVWVLKPYNQLVALSENTNARWADVENTYQKRVDLVPNLVSTVKKHAKYEQDTFTAVAEARAKAGKVEIKADQLTTDNLQKFREFQNAQGGFSSALSRLMVVVEKYPELKADKSFQKLMGNLESIENEILERRDRFTKAAQMYNYARRSFPVNFVAKLFDFKERIYFEAEKGSGKAPKVDFD